MRFETLASSSHGNCYFISDGQTKILLECGITYKKLQTAVGFDITQFSACLLSHCHSDHSKSVNDLLKRGMPVYMSLGTKEALNVEGVELVEHMEQFQIGSFDCIAFDVFHDAREPLGFLIKSRVDGDVLAFATDTVNLRYRFPGVNILSVEANFDPDILSRNERLPKKTKHRIENTHMSIEVLCDYLSTMDLNQCREIYLLHLSDGTSHEGHFINKVEKVVPSYVKVTACGRG